MKSFQRLIEIRQYLEHCERELAQARHEAIREFYRQQIELAKKQLEA